MPGQEQPAARARVAGSAVPDGPAEPGSSGTRPPRSLAARTNRPAVPALIATLAAVAFTLARWQTWANGHISRFILVGRHFAIPSQLPHGMPVAKTYGYDGQFFYRLAINPADFARTAYGITVDQPYRFMRIGYPVITWLASAGQRALVAARGHGLAATGARLRPAATGALVLAGRA